MPPHACAHAIFVIVDIWPRGLGYIQMYFTVFVGKLHLKQLETQTKIQDYHSTLCHADNNPLEMLLSGL